MGDGANRGVAGAPLARRVRRSGVDCVWSIGAVISSRTMAARDS